MILVKAGPNKIYARGPRPRGGGAAPQQPMRRRRRGQPTARNGCRIGERGAELAQKSGQFQRFVDVFPVSHWNAWADLRIDILVQPKTLLAPSGTEQHLVAPSGT